LECQKDSVEKETVRNFLGMINNPQDMRNRVVAVEESEPGIESRDFVQCLAKKYKPVALKVRPVLGELPEKFRIVRNISGNPLVTLPNLPVEPGEVIPKGRYTQERMEKMDRIHDDGFLWPEEKRLMHWLVMEQNDAFAWEDSERRSFKDEF